VNMRSPIGWPLTLTFVTRVNFMIKKNTWTGALFMIMSAVSFAAAHAGVRELSPGIHPFATAFYRNIFGFFLLLPWLVRDNFNALRTNCFKMHVLRGGLNSGFMLGFFFALSLIPIAEATALNFTAPLFATLLAVVILKEQVGWRRWTAIVVGFSGTLVILQPGAEVISVGAFLVFFASLSWAGSTIALKKLSSTESSLTSTTYLVIVLTPITFFASFPYLSVPNLEQLIWLIEVAATSTIAQFFLSESLKRAEATVVIPFDFSRLIWAAVLGFIMFDEIPTIWVWLGGSLIFASAIYITHRETLAKGS
jgi:drug/metabolite transporter (DMT)-like permease